MSKHRKSDESAQLNSTDRNGLKNDSENFTKHELFKNFDEDRRSFLKKLLISAAYVTPVILSFSIGDSEARARKKRPTKKERKQGRKKKQKKQKTPYGF